MAPIRSGECISTWVHCIVVLLCIALSEFIIKIMSSSVQFQDGARRCTCAHEWFRKHDSIYNIFRMQKQYYHNTMTINSKWTHIAALPLGHVDHRCRDGVHDDNDELLLVGASDFYITCTQIDCTKHTSLRASINDTHSTGRRLQLWYEEARRGKVRGRLLMCGFNSAKNEGLSKPESVVTHNQLSPSFCVLFYFVFNCI